MVSLVYILELKFKAGCRPGMVNYQFELEHESMELAVETAEKAMNEYPSISHFEVKTEIRKK